MSPLLIHHVTPDYGTIARQTGISGAVFLKVLVGCDGRVQTVTISSGPEALRQVTIDAVKQWVYRPYLVNGRPQAVELNMGLSMDFGATALYEVASPGRVRVASGVMAGYLRSQQDPVIPPLPPNSKVSGATILHVVVGRDGRVLEISTVSGPEIIRSPVMDAVRQWRYKPFLVDDHPVEVETTITLNIDFFR